MFLPKPIFFMAKSTVYPEIPQC